MRLSGKNHILEKCQTLEEKESQLFLDLGGAARLQQHQTLQIETNSKQTVEIRAILFERLGSVQGVRVGPTWHRAHATLVVYLPPLFLVVTQCHRICMFGKYSLY